MSTSGLSITRLKPEDEREEMVRPLDLAITARVLR
jgi:hypothetical protein